MAKSKILVAEALPAWALARLAYAALLHSVSGAAETLNLETNRMLFMLALHRVC